MNIDEIKKMNEIVIRLITGNVANGMTFDEAKAAAFNRLFKESSLVLSEYLKQGRI